MGKGSLLFCLFLILNFCYSQKKEDDSNVKPIFVITETKTQFPSVETPLFVLYNNKEIIYRKLDSENSLDYKITKLDSAEYFNFIDFFKKARFYDFESKYSPSGVGSFSHPTYTSLYSFLGRFTIKISIKEDIREHYVLQYLRNQYSEDTTQIESHNPLEWIPEQLLTSIEKSISFEHPEEATWVPHLVEMRLFRRKAKCEQEWTEYWSIDELALSHIEDNTVSSFKPPNKEFMNMLIHQNQNSCFIKVNNKKYVPEFRLTFPLEKSWKD